MTAVKRIKRALRRAAGPFGSVTAVRGSAALVALTYDDGPEPGGTDRVLDALAEAGATATFFVLLTRVRRHPALLQRILTEGHEIGLHGIDHQPLTSFSAAEVRRRCETGRDELEQAAQRPVRWMRPPYGKQTPATAWAIRASGLTAVLWGPTTADTLEAPTAVRVERATAGVRGGAILLAHDGFAGPDDGVDDGPAPVLDRGALCAGILAEYAARGLAGRSLTTVLDGGRPVREAVFRR
jgi:peptidoglycan/xylan/chitin deacetylase (PgdA/CDA1 family)